MSFGENVADLVETSTDPVLAKSRAWARVPLGDVASILNGYPWKSELFTKSEGHRLIRIRDVTTGDTETRYDGLVVDGFWVEDGDLLVGMDGDFNVRRWRAERALLNQRVCKITVDPASYDGELLEYVLPAYLRLINKMTSSVTVKHLSSRTLAEIPLPFPPRAEQRRIVAKLDVLTARQARALAELDRVPVLAERGHIAILRSGVTGALTADWRIETEVETVTDLLMRVSVPQQGRGGREATDKVISGTAALAVNDPGTTLPDGWAWAPLLRVAKQETGHTPSRSRSDYWDGGVPWIGIRDAGAHHGEEIQDTAQTISEAERTFRLPIDTLAKMLDFTIEGAGNYAAHADRLLPFRRYLIAAISTVARPDAIFDMSVQPAREQWVRDHKIYALNPKGRLQTKKVRPVVPVTGVLADWLAATGDQFVCREWDIEEPDGALEPRQQTVASIDSAWSTACQKFEVPPGWGPKLIRHSVATILASKRVDLVELEILLGHRPVKKTTAKYTIFDPDYLLTVRQALEDLWSELAELCRYPLHPSFTQEERRERQNRARKKPAKSLT